MIWDALPLLARGLGWTLYLFVGGAVLATILALLAGLGATSRRWQIRLLANAYAELFRGVSLVVQLFWIFFALPAFGIQLSEVSTAIVGLGLCFGAYGTEVVRSAILTIGRGQREAAEALGLKRSLATYLVVFPQALPVMLPPYGNLMIQLLKSTSVAALITIPELTFQATTISNNFGGGAGLFMVILVCYYSISKTILFCSMYLERRMSPPGHGGR